MQWKPSPLQPYPTQNNNTKWKAKINHSIKHPTQLNKHTVEIKNSQMRKTDQRWRQRNATDVADVVACNVWGTGSALKIMKTARAKQQIKQNQQQYCMRHMPAAMVHGGGGGVLPMIMTKLASQQTIKKHKVTKQNSMEALSITTISNSKQQHKMTSTKNLRHQTLCSFNHTSNNMSNSRNQQKSKKKKTVAPNTWLRQKNLLPRSSSFKWERWTKDDDSAMQPAMSMRLPAMCERRGAH